MFLPVIGVCIGVIICLWHALCTLLSPNALLEAAGYTLLPLLVSGAIHLDGFCDTADALASNADSKKRQEILRDPHSGAFAIIAVVLYLLAFFGLASELQDSWHTALAFSSFFVISRAFGGLATLLFPCSGASSFAAALRNHKARTISVVVLVLWLLAGAVLLILCGSWQGAIALTVAVLFVVWSRFWLLKKFEGFSGDLAGWLIQMLELLALAGYVFSGLVLTVL